MVIISALRRFYYLFYYVDMCAGWGWGCHVYLSTKCLQRTEEDVAPPCELELQAVVSCPM